MLEPVDTVLSQDKHSSECFISETSEYYFNKTVDLLKDKEIRLILLAAPYIITNDEIPVYHWISNYAESRDITFMNMTDDSLLEEISFKRAYMNDSRHVNPNGAEIVSGLLSDILRN